MSDITSQPAAGKTITSPDQIASLVESIKAWIESGVQVLTTFKNSPACNPLWKPIITTIITYLGVLEIVIGMIG